MTKRYGTTVAVDALTFEVKPGIVTDFLGPNGAGKSTMMRMILGLDAPTSGSVTVNGLDQEGIEWIRTLMRQFAAEGRTVFISSHPMSETEQNADHVLVIGRGRLVADLSMVEFTHRSAHSQVRIVSAPALTTSFLICPVSTGRFRRKLSGDFHGNDQAERRVLSD